MMAFGLVVGPLGQRDVPCAPIRLRAVLILERYFK